MTDTLPPMDRDPAAQRRAWFASLLLRHQNTWFGRFTLRLRQLAGLRRGQRRRLQRKAAVSLAGAALLLSLGAGAMRPPTVHAASITVDNGVVVVADDGQCSLIEAILSANADAAIYATAGECAPGSGADTINLPAGGLFTLTTSYSYQAYSDTGLPPIDSAITIEGNGSEITRDGAAPDFRIMAVSATGNLTLKTTRLSNGYSQEDGGGLYNEGYALLQNSQISGNGAYDDGGGAENDGGTLIIENSTFDFNDAGSHGGGIANEDGGDLTITLGSRITDNTALDNGGGIDQDNTGGPITIADSTISGNEAYAGGGLYAYAGGLITITGTVIDNNKADIAGGGIATYRATLLIENGTSITGNKATYGGGTDFYLSDVTITDSDITGNTGYYQGGGLHLDGSTVTIARSTINDNTVPMDDIGYFGGGIFSGEGYDDDSQQVYYSDLTIVDSTLSGNSAVGGGAIFNYYGNILTVLNSTLSDNSAAIGGGLLNLYGLFTIANSTISGNQANQMNSFGGYGGGIWNVSEYVDTQSADNSTIVLSTVTGNSATDFGGGIANLVGGFQMFGSIVSGNSAPDAGEINDDSGGIYSVFNLLGENSRTTAQAIVGLTPGPNLIATSDDANIPLGAILSTTLADNGGPTETHALVSNSPAIDILPDFVCVAGNPLGLDLSADQRGEPRSVDIPGVGNDGTDVCDIGAYEYQEPLVGGFCPIDDPAVALLRTDLIGAGMGSPTRGIRQRKVALPNYQDVETLYGQLAAVDWGVMKYVRFTLKGSPPVQVKPPTSPAYRTAAVDWWGADLTAQLPSPWAKGAFFYGKGANRAPRAFALWPTYRTDTPYANVFAPFDNSADNHVYWNEAEGWVAQQTQVVAMPPTQAPGATVEVKVALVDVNRDGRRVILTVEADGAAPIVREIVQANSRDSLNIETFLLAGVAAGADEVRITLESPEPDGDSAAMIGAAVNYACEPIDPPLRTALWERPALSGPIVDAANLWSNLLRSPQTNPAAATDESRPTADRWYNQLRPTAGHSAGRAER
jgi:hypothetical protein